MSAGDAGFGRPHASSQQYEGITMIDHLIAGRQRDIGGFCVRRVLPSPKRRLVGPFIFFDEMGPSQFAPGDALEVRAHPHIGLATLTYLFDGRIVHRDTTPVEQTISPGAVNLMIAGGGIVHSERSHGDDVPEGHGLHGLQLWLALPKSHEQGPASFHHTPETELPKIEGRTMRGRVVMGEAYGLEAASTFPWPALFVELRIDAGTRCPLPEALECGVFVVSGRLRIGDTEVPAGTMATVDAGPLDVEALENSQIAVVGGDPMDGPRAIEWNFVASDPALIEAAKADWRAAPGNGFSGRFPMPAGEHDHIPLPGEAATDRQGAPEPVKDCPTS